MTATQAMNAARIVFAMLTVCGVTVVMAWQSLTGPIEKIDEFAQQYYNGSKWDAWNRLDEEDPDYTTRLISLAEELDYVQKNDALDMLKRKVLSALTQRLLLDGKPALAVAWSDRWVAFDSRSVSALTFKAYLLMFSEQTREEGSEMFAMLLKRFPAQLSIAAMQVQALYAVGEPLAAFQVMRPYLSEQSPLRDPLGEPYLGFWKVDAGTGVSRFHKPQIKNGRWTLSVHVGADISEVTISNEQKVALKVVRPRLLIDETAVVDVQSNLPGSGEQYFKDSEQVIDFVWRFPDKKVQMLEVDAGVKTSLPASFRRVASDRQLSGMLRAAGDTEGMAALSRAFALMGER